MKKIAGLFNHNFILFASILMASVMFFSLDAYCYNAVTTAFDIINIAGIRMEVMDFVYILFAVTCTVGLMLGFIIKKHLHTYTSITSVFLGAIMLVLAFMDVDLFQSLFPSMRISHVIMTLSQIIIIMIGASGLMIGANLAYVVRNREKLNIKVAVISLLVGVGLSIFAISEHLYNFLYGLIAMFIILGTIIFQFNKIDCDKSSDEKLTAGGAITVASNCSAVAAIAIIVGTMYNYLVNTVSVSPVGYIIIIACMFIMIFVGRQFKTAQLVKITVWLITAIAAIVACFVQTAIMASLTLLLMGYSIGVCITKQPHARIGAVSYCATISIMSIISLVIIKLLSQEIKHSNNRIYYRVNASVFAIILAFLIVTICLKLVNYYVINKKVVTTN